MEKSIIAAALNKKYTSEEAFRMNPLTLAWIGDGVFSDIIRRFLVAQGNAHVNHLTRLSFTYVCAETQARILHSILPFLNAQEKDIVRRGRNTKSTPPKHADKMDYRFATGMEALVGYLALTDQTDRLMDLILTGLENLEADKI